MARRSYEFVEASGDSFEALHAFGVSGESKRAQPPGNPARRIVTM